MTTFTEKEKKDASPMNCTLIVEPFKHSLLSLFQYSIVSEVMLLRGNKYVYLCYN